MVRIEVVDTNVWASVDKIPPDNAIEADCVRACIGWFQAFRDGEDDRKLAVDTAWKILTEYRRNIKAGGLAERYLNDLLSQPIERIEFKKIEFDSDGNAILQSAIVDDPADRKFVAVALCFEPPAPIINAADTDWRKAHAALRATGIIVEELCPAYIESRLK